MGRVKKYLSLFLTMILVSGLLSGIDFSAKNSRAAEVHAMSGAVSVKKAGGEKAFKTFVGMALTEGDTLITGKNGKATLRVEDELEFIVAENTQILISKLVKSESGETITRIDLKSGGVWSKVKKGLSSGSKYEIKTPTVVLGARGTEFYTKTFLSQVEGDVFRGKIFASYYQIAMNGNQRIEKVTLEVSLEAGQSVKVSGTPNELKDFFVDAIKLENLDRFSLEMLKELLKEYPELKMVWDEEKIDELIDIKSKEQEEEYKAFEELVLKLSKQPERIEFYDPTKPIEPVEVIDDLPIEDPGRGDDLGNPDQPGFQGP